jgi:hypothetical protein
MKGEDLFQETIGFNRFHLRDADDAYLGGNKWRFS